MSDEFTSSGGQVYHDLAKKLRNDLDKGYDENTWDNPDRVDLWRMYNWCAEVEESYSHMMQSVVATVKGVININGNDALPYFDELTELNKTIHELNRKWNLVRGRLNEITNDLYRKDLDKMQAIADARNEERKRLNELALMKRAGRLGF
jgi:hypothetical protein